MVDNTVLEHMAEYLERIAVALEAIVLNMEKPKWTRQDDLDYLETLGRG